MMLKPLRRAAAAFSLSVLCVAPAAAAVVHVFDISGVSTRSDFPTSFPTLVHDFGLAGTVTRVEFDVRYESFDPSWQSEMQIAIDSIADLSLDGDIDLSAFGAPNAPGVFAGAGFVNANTVSVDGRVFLTAYESFDDSAVDPDATFGPNSFVRVTYQANQAIPEPGSLALSGLALGLLGWSVRHRRGMAGG